MSILAPIKSARLSKVHHSEYIRTAIKPEEGTKPSPAPSESTKPEAE